MIVENFFEKPRIVRDILDMSEMKDHKFSDGVTYPNIVKLAEVIQLEVDDNMMKLFGPMYKPVLSFGRYSFENTKPPHWAHSDRNIAEFLVLIYLTPGREAEEFGTATLEHISTGLTSHPNNETERALVLNEANKQDAWRIDHVCRAKFNRAFILNANLIHAALGECGTERNDGRLVITQFFNLVPDAK